MRHIPILPSHRTLVRSVLSTETVAALQAFRKRHSDAQRITGQLNAQPTTVDLAHYRSVLKNKAIVDEADKILRDFKPVTYDVGAHIKAIETFETKAVRIPLFLFPIQSPLRVADHTHTLAVVPVLSRTDTISGRQGKGDRGKDRRRAERSPSDAFEHPGCASLRGSDGAFSLVLLLIPPTPSRPD